MTWVPLKRVADVWPSSVDKLTVDGEHPVRLVNYTDVYYGDRLHPGLDLMAATATADEIGKFRLQRGDVVLTKDSETADDIGASAYVDEAGPDMVCGYHLSLVRPRAAVGRYLHYAISSTHARWQMSVAATGVTRFGLRAESVGSLSVWVPSEAEQRAIAAYLDAETARIDALIAKKQQLIQLIELQFLERCRAMTTPLDAPVAPLRWTASAVRTGSTPSADASWMMSDGGSVEWFTPGDVGERLTLHPAARRLDAVALRSGQVPTFPAQSTLLVGIGATAGKVALMPKVGSSNQQITAVVPGERLLPRFLAWQLWARGAEMRATAPYTTLPILNNDFVKSFQIHVPTLEAQSEIVDDVDRLDRLATALTGKLDRQTRCLAEHRQALITAVATGDFAASR